MDELRTISAVASSSNSSSMVSSKKYDVFLSFRGEDTRLNFTGHLYNALNDKKVKTYDNQLEKGHEEKISRGFMKAIEDSHVSVVIFSENYASSMWRLRELSKILECKKVQGQIVIPVFYGIDPSHVRKQTGSYEQAFPKHEADPVYNKWRADLTEVATLAGWDSRNRKESEVIKDVVEEVLQKLAPLQKLDPRYRKKYDVFLSYRGEYTRRNISSLLYEALIEEKVKTYIDDRLSKGDEISPAVTEAIEDSRVSIVIFSENYASSKWCLHELSKILECRKVQGQIVIPVFYGIDPSHVRTQTGSYKQAFAKHEGDPIYNKWRADLIEVTTLAGWDSRNRKESEVVKGVVKEVLESLSPLQKLAPRYPKKYDVFLSFRGEDTRKNFTSHLNKALKEEKVKTYIDDQLKKGDEISPALTEAIKDSHVSIIIFSENYASSKWCLNELSKILECQKDQGQIVIPVFYNVDPSHVRKQTRSYEQAFAEHEGDPRCYKWRDDLTKAANLAGWDSRNRTETELLKEIVEDVLQKLALIYPNQRKRPVGIDKNYEQIKSLLEIGSSEVKILGIWGMGGIGKTTLATALFENLSSEFDGHCLLANVRENSNKLEALQNDLYKTLLNNKNHRFDNFDISRLQRKKVFIVLDDVSTSKQLEKLIEEYDFLGPGSRVIITTRNKEILSPGYEIYQVKELSFDHSLQLFCLNAFQQKQPKDGFEDLSRSVVSYCKGIPLALKVLGASLRPRSKEAWECELRKLGKIPNMEIYEVFKLSYDGLDQCQKDIFLDIACFFKGWHRDRLTSLLEACNFYAISNIEILLDKALLTISDDNEIEMHDLIQEMGWQIVDQEDIKFPRKRSRLWRLKDVLDVFKSSRATDVVEGISIDLCKLTRDLHLSSNFLANMTNVRCLMIHDLLGSSNGFKVYLPNGESLSDNLRCLHWDGFCLESLPPTFCAEQLVELRMRDSKLKKLWDGIQDLVNLKTIDLSYSRDLIEIPDLSKADKLGSISLIYCQSLCQLHVYSKSLCILKLEGCSSLKEFSVTSVKMTELNLADTAICALPSSIWHNRKLASLSLKGWNNLEFVENIGHFSSLEELDLSGTKVEIFPANIENLSMLKRLRLDDCKKLQSLPELPSLREVSALNCTSLETDTTQQLVILHMLQSQLPCHFIFPGGHVTDFCGFRTASSSITIPYLPKSGLCGFIYCFILSKHATGFGTTESSIPVSYYICHDDIRIGRDDRVMACKSNLISDHVLFSYVDISQFDRINEVLDHFGVIFEFDHYDEKIKLKHDQERIKGCGLFPVYATERGLKIVGSSIELHEAKLEALRLEMRRGRTSP